LYIFHGDIANFRLFNRPLTQDEIYQLYAYQKEYFGHGDLSMTLKAGRLGIGTSEPRADLDVRGDIHGGCPVFFQRTAGQNTGEDTTFNFNRVLVSKGGGWGDTTKFFAPIAGYYHISFSCMSTFNEGVHAFRFRKNGVDHPSTNEDARVYGYIQINNIDSRTYMRLAGQTIMYLAVGDYMDILNEPDTTDMHVSYNQLTGFYLSS